MIQIVHKSGVDSALEMKQHPMSFLNKTKCFCLFFLADAFERRIKKATPAAMDDEIKSRKKIIKIAVGERIKYLRAS